jgi:hypothetical protein
MALRPCIDHRADIRHDPGQMSAGFGRPDADRLHDGSGHRGNVDLVHSGTDSATIRQLGDGTRVLRVEESRVANSPAPYDNLSAHPAPRDSRQPHEGPAFDIGGLDGNVGNQDDELPAGVRRDRGRRCAPGGPGRPRRAGPARGQGGRPRHRRHPARGRGRHPGLLRSEAALAHLRGVAPIPASSGEPPPRPPRSRWGFATRIGRASCSRWGA